MRRAIVCCLAVICLVAPLVAEEYLPTPYTAEQIRDVWQVGFEVTTRTRSSAGESYSRTTVVEATEARFRMTERAVDAQGVPIDDDVSEYAGTWEELRDHARFPESTASRQRVRRQTPLGHLDGWLYRVYQNERIAELFFADGVPGPPVLYRRMSETGGEVLAEQISRRP